MALLMLLIIGIAAKAQTIGWGNSLPNTAMYGNYTDLSIRQTLAERASYNNVYNNWWNGGYANTGWLGRRNIYYNQYGWYPSLPNTANFDNYADRSIRQTLIERAQYGDIYGNWNDSRYSYPAQPAVQVIIIMQEPHTRCCGRYQ